MPAGLDAWNVGLVIRWDDEAEADGLLEEAFFLVDLMVKYQYNNSNFQLNIDNLLDETHHTDGGRWANLTFGKPISGTFGIHYSF